LEKLSIECGLNIQHSHELLSFLQGLAAVSKLRLLILNLYGTDPVITPQQQSEMLAIALQDGQNQSLECFGGNFAAQNNGFDQDVWKRLVRPILRFNQERRSFEENEYGCTHGERLDRALETAKESENHHLLYWLVRSYAGYLCDRES
jgi:hypothetical protein